MTTAEYPDCAGVLNVDKPSGMTSRDVVDLVARVLPRKTKAGHAGTLDPLASGVLVVCVGSATRLIEYVQRMPKTYRAVIRLGARSDTLDADGEIVETDHPPIPAEAAVRKALKAQVGVIQQLPPQYSALKVNGKRAYDLARAGQEATLAARPVRIDRIDLVAYTWPQLEIVVNCGSGTYIRSIARDVGEALGCGGLIEVLVRTRVGPFEQSEAIDPRTLTSEAIPAVLRPAVQAVADLPRLRLPAEAVARVLRGQQLDARRLARGPEALPPGEIALLDSDGELVAVAEHRPRTHLVLPRRVLARMTPSSS